MKNITFLFALFISSVCCAQYVITIEAKVVDAQTNAPIPYANVGFIEKAIGTVTNEEGHMTLEFDENRIVDKDIIQFSVVGYVTEQYSFEQLIEKFQKGNVVSLTKEIYSLDEVIVKSRWGKEVPLGSKDRTDKLLAYWKDKDALGGEIAGFIKTPRGPHKLFELSFNVVENISDSVKIRVNVYDYDKRYPGKKLLSEPIYHTITSNQGIEKVNLSPANIVVNSDFVISIELIEVYGGELGLAISQSVSTNRSFLRYVSQDKWVRESERGVDLSVLARPALKDENSTSQVVEKIDNVSILWDVSLSMKDRNIEEEIALLDKYFKEVNPSTVGVTLFSNTVTSTRTFDLSTEREALYNYLETQDYLGNTDASALIAMPHSADVTLLFSDGKFNLGNKEPIYTQGAFIAVNSAASGNHLLLNSWSQANDGKYIPLYGQKSRKAVAALLSAPSSTTETVQVNEANQNLISGSVSSNGNSLQGVYVGVNNTLNEVSTDAEGNFTINAEVGDVLSFEFLNMLPKNVLVENNEPIIVTLEAEFDVLEEVTLQGKSKKEELSTQEKREREKNRASGQYTTLEKKDFPPGATQVSDIVRRIPSVQVKGFGREARIITRGSVVGLFVVDGVYFNSVPNFINPSTITSISVIPSVIGAAKYGTQGRSGVIIITTVFNERFRKEAQDSALVKGNDYKSTLKTFSTDNDINDFEGSLNNSLSKNGEKVVIKGTVKFNDKPVQGCYVFQENSLNEAITDTEGNFSISTQIGATLNFEFVETKTKQILIIDDAFQNVNLESQYEILSEVTLEGSKAREKKSDLTGKEQRDAQKNRSGIAYQSIDKEDFNEGGFTYLVDLIRGRFLTIGVNGEGDQATYYTRKPSSINLDPTIIFAVDGMVFRDPPTWINLRNIENITFKSTLAGTNKYGALGRNGVIEITTIEPELTKNAKEESALVTNNDYTGSTNEFSSSRKFTQFTSDSKDVKVIKKQFSTKIEEDPYDLNNYIAYYKVMEPINRPEAIRGLSTVIELGDKNTRVLRSLAFFLEEEKIYDEAQKIHEHILTIAPKESQTYLDLAQSYKNAKNYEESFETLKAVLVGDSTIFKSSEELVRIAETEIKHLLTKYKDRVDYTEVPSSFYETVQIVDRRILVEWNDPQLEFDLQFVNPSKKFYNWSQNLSDDNNNEDEAVRDGLLSKEFIIDDDPSTGEWLVNITNNTIKKSRIPAFIKMTVYTNYGGPEEEEQILIIPLSQLDQKYTVQKIDM